MLLYDFGEILTLDKRDEVVHAYANHSKFESVFHPKLYTKLKTGLEQMAHWVATHGSRESKSFNNIEIEKNLPDSWKKIG